MAILWIYLILYATISFKLHQIWFEFFYEFSKFTLIFDYIKTFIVINNQFFYYVLMALSKPVL